MTKEELIRYGKDYLHDLETACCSISDIHKEFVRESIKSLEQQSSEDAISLQAVINMTGLSNWFESSDDYNNFVEELCTLPLITPTHGTCKECEHWNGYRYCAWLGIQAEADFYCKDFKKRGSENDSRNL